MGEKDELPVPAMISLPLQAATAGLIFVVDGHFLRETASISRAIWGLRTRPCGSIPVPMFHLVTDIRQVILETEEQLRTVNAAISPDGRANTTVELQDQPCVPLGAVLLAEEGSLPVLPEVTELPAVVKFKLRMPSLGLVTRLRDRYGCTISEIFCDVMTSLLKQGSL